MNENTSPTTKGNGDESSYGGAYAKKGSMPMWAWILIYVVIGGIIYYAGYAIWKAKHPATANNLYGTSGQTKTPIGGAGGSSIYKY